MTPEISIIVPVYGVEKYVKDCVLSILAQKCTAPLEVLFVDDCTEDNSIEIIKETLSEHTACGIEFNILRHEKNKGQGEARNTGIRNARGRYLMFVDSDDVLPSDCCSELEQIIADSKCDYDMVVGNRDIIDMATGETLHRGKRCSQPHILTTIEEYLAWPLQGEASNKLLKRDFIVNHDLYFEGGVYFEDTLWFHKLMCYQPLVLYIPTVLYIYHVRSNSTMTTLNLRHFYSLVRNAIVSHDFAQECELTTGWYAAETAYSHRKLAMTYFYSKTKPGLRNFFRIYRILARRIPSGVLSGKFDTDRFSTMQKIRLVCARLHYPFNAIGELLFIMIKSRQMKRYLLRSSPIRLPEKFFLRLETDLFV